MTWPFDVYITTVEVDPDTGEWDVLKFVGVDDCGVRINPMIVEGQLHGGLAEAFAMAYHQMITFDSQGNCIGANYIEYMIPTAWEVPHFDLYEVVTPSPHHPIGCKGIGSAAASVAPPPSSTPSSTPSPTSGSATSTCPACRAVCGKRSSTRRTSLAPRRFLGHKPGHTEGHNKGKEVNNKEDRAGGGDR